MNSCCYKSLMVGSVLACLALPQADAQVRFIEQPKVVQVQTPVKRTKLIQETVYEQVPVTEEVPVITTETRYRKRTAYRPVVKNKILEERYEVLKPVTETSYRDQVVEETEMEEVTEMRKQSVVVEKPVTETAYRDEQVLVRKPVEKTLYQSENVTSYRPETVAETTYAESDVLVGSPAAVPGPTQLEWLRRGYYFDPTQNAYVFRRGGLHWVNSPAPTTTAQRALVPQTSWKTVLVPQTTTQLKPVTVNSVEEVWETRRVPYSVQTTQKVVQEVDVPVVVRKPVVRQKTQRVPINETKYQTQEVVRRTPFTETSWQCVEENEPYQVQVQKYVKQTRMVSVPKTVYREVPYETTETTSRIVMERVAVDENGNPLPVVEADRTPQLDGTTGGSQETQTASKPEVSMDAFGQFRRNGETSLLKDSRVIDAPAKTQDSSGSGTKEMTETSGRTTSKDSGTLQSVLTLEPKVLKPISERPGPQEADLPPTMERPGSRDSAGNSPSPGTSENSENPATKSTDDPALK